MVEKHTIVGDKPRGLLGFPEGNNILFKVGHERIEMAGQKRQGKLLASY